MISTISVRSSKYGRRFKASAINEQFDFPVPLMCLVQCD